MLKSFFRSMSVAMLIVGTVIGAGFASGREVVTFFGTEPNVFIALITGALVFGCSVLFMFVGRQVKKSDIGEVNGAIFGRLRPVADIFMLFNSMTVLGAMLAGTDSLAAEFIDIRPFGSIILGVICAVITATNGLRGVLKANAVLVPIMIAALAVCTASVISYPFEAGSAPIAPVSVVLYVSMNMILGGSVLTTVSKLSPREMILAAFVASLTIAALLMLIMGALRSTYSSEADIPMLLIALKSGRVMYFVVLPVIAMSIFTTMLSAFKSVYDYLLSFVRYRWVSAGLVLICGSLVGAFGFSNVVGGLYPVIGGIGLLYIACNAWFLIRTRQRRAPLHKRRVTRRGTCA